MAEALPFPERVARRFLLSLFDLPRSVLSAAVGVPSLNDRGDRLDSDLQAICRLDALVTRDRKALTPTRARQDMLRSLSLIEGAPRLLARTEELVLSGMRARLYVPQSSPGRQAPRLLPLLVYLHGGGWVVGDLRTHDRLCRRLAADGQQLVVAVDYPLAPEHPYPGSLRGALQAFRWIRDNAVHLGADPARIAIGGDSAGGNLSAAVCLRLRDEGEAQPAFQLLIYPALDLRCLSASYHALGHGYLLTQQSIQWYIGHYGADPLDPRASVLLEPDLSGLAPAIVTTAGFDPLRDDGELFVQRLREAGGVAEHLPFPSLVHGFANMDAVPAASRATAQLIERVRTAWEKIAGARTEDR